jgi:hypothetical protein
MGLAAITPVTDTPSSLLKKIQVKVISSEFSIRDGFHANAFYLFHRSRIASFSACLKTSAGNSPFFHLYLFSSRSCGLRRLPTWSARNGGCSLGIRLNIILVAFSRRRQSGSLRR